tara:strand:+ start:5289 stop:5837 length:549 start_codon:yes stop_codon:yes gene_type:complete
MSAESLKIVRGLAQAAANAYDGALDDEGNPIEIGLKREEGHPVYDSRTLDGFKVTFSGPHMIVNYQAEIKLKDVYKGGFESELEQTIEDIVSYLKKQYRKITGESVSLKADGEVKAIVQNTSRVRTFVQAHKKYVIAGLADVKEILEPSSGDLQDGFQKFLDQGGFQGKRPENDSRKVNNGS